MSLADIKPLYLVWNNDFLQGRPIIDEQHRGVVATINSLNFFVQQGLELDSLKPTIKVLEDYLMFHYVTEEGILAATEYPNMNEYQQRTHQTKVQLRQICEVAIDKNDPQMLLQFLGEWWQKHLVFHDEFSPYLSGWSGKYCRLSHIDLDWI